MVHDSGIYFTQLAAKHGVPVPDLGLIAPLEFYRTAAQMSHTLSLHSALLPRQDLLTLFPKDAAGLRSDGSGGTIKTFTERERDLEALRIAAGGIC